MGMVRIVRGVGPLTHRASGDCIDPTDCAPLVSGATRAEADLLGSCSSCGKSMSPGGPVQATCSAPGCVTSPPTPESAPSMTESASSATVSAAAVTATSPAAVTATSPSAVTAAAAAEATPAETTASPSAAVATSASPTTASAAATSGACSGHGRASEGETDQQHHHERSHNVHPCMRRHDAGYTCHHENEIRTVDAVSFMIVR